MRLSTPLLAVFVNALTLSACGIDSNTGSSGGVQPQASLQNVPLRTSCSVMTPEDDRDPANTEVYRHEAPMGVLRLSLRKLPMTCADSYAMSASWGAENTKLTLDVRGQHYKHCLCTVDLDPINVEVPMLARPRLDEVMLAIVRGDVGFEPLKTVRIGEVPFQGQP